MTKKTERPYRDGHVWLEPELWEAIRKVARKNERSTSAEIRMTLKERYQAQRTA